MEEITIFYSWQSDLPDNRKIIRNALHQAVPTLEENDVKITLDEATRGKVGSPNIPSTIIEKIKRADIFIGDVTTINSICDCNTRKTPNPNVVFELGFATSILGWDRIVLLVNTSYTDLSKDLPFDFDRHRMSKFEFGPDDSKHKSTTNLASFLADIISAIISSNPEKEIEKQFLSSPEQIKKKRDIENIKWIMSTIHQPTLQEQFDNGPRAIEGRMFHFWESFKDVFTNNLFHLYDRNLYQKLDELYNSLGKTLSYGEHYRSLTHADKFVFHLPMDVFSNEKQEEDWKKIEKSLVVMNMALKDINEIIRNDYLEIDTKKMNKAAWTEYIEFQKKYDENDE